MRDEIMQVPKVHGVIRRRLLVNFRVESAVMQRHLIKGLTFGTLKG